MRILKQSFTYLGGLGTLATLHTYYAFLNNNNVSKPNSGEINNTIESNNPILKNATEHDWKLEAVKIKITGYTGRTTDYQSEINDSRNELNNYKEMLDNSHLYTPEDIAKAKSYILHHNEQIQSIKNKFIEDGKLTLEEIIKIISDKGNQFINDNYNFIKEILNKWNNFLSTLSIDQLCALSNLLLGIMILFFLFNIIFIYYGDILIKYLSLETKYPKLAKIINLRRKVLNFYISIYFLLIIISLILLILVDVSYLFLR